MNASDAYRTLVSLATENWLIERLFFASLEFAVLAVFLGSLIFLLRLKSARLTSFLWLLVLAKPLVSLTVGSPIPVVPLFVPSSRAASAAHDIVPPAETVGLTDEQVLPGEPVGIRLTQLAPEVSYRATETWENAPEQSLVDGPAPVASQPGTSQLPEIHAGQVMVGVWLVGFIYFAVGELLSHIRARRLVASSTPPNLKLSNQFAELTKQLGGRRIPTLRITDQLESPALVGVFWPVILIPAWLARDGSKNRSTLTWSLRHELMHWKLGDPIANLIPRVAQILFFFHPAAWWAGKRCRAAMELACDRALVATEAEARDYAEGLYHVLSAMHNPRRPALSTSLFATRTQIGRRIAVLLNGPLRSSARLSIVSIACVAALTIVTLAVGSRFAESGVRGSGDGGLAVEAGADETDAEGARSPDSGADERAKQSQENPATITGRVLDPEGKPIPHATLAVFVWSHRPARDRQPVPPIEVWAESKAGADGRYFLKFPRPPSPDFYVKRAYQIALIAGREGYGLGFHFLKFDLEKIEADIPLLAEQVRRGRVVDTEGQAVPGAIVHVVSAGKPAPKRAPFRRWHNDGLPQDEMVFTSVCVKDTDPGDGSQLWEGEVRFREPPLDVPVWPKPTTTDAEGRFTLRGVGHGQRIRMQIYGTEQITSEEFAFDMSDEAEPKESAFSADVPRLIEDTVTDATTGKPVAGAKVQVDAAGYVTFPAKWPVVADWKGRQDHPGPGHCVATTMPEFHIPPVRGVTDENGRYRLSPFQNLHGLHRFAVTVSGPDDRPYMSVKKSLVWPKTKVVRQTVDISLPPGVRVRGQVVEAGSGRPIPRARIDFWSKDLKYPAEHIAAVATLALSPDGIVHPPWRKADFSGRFEIIVPAARGYLLVNGGSDDFVIDRIAGEEVGMEDPASVVDTPLHLFPPGTRAGRKHYYYPDRVVALDYPAFSKIDLPKIALRRALRLKINVVTPDGKAATNLRFFGGQAPFKEDSHGWLASVRIKPIGDGQFEIPVRDLKAPVCVAFIDAENRLGATAEIPADQAGGEAVTVRLAPFGSATARFVSQGGEPLADYRPLIWRSLPQEPYSSPTHLERLATPK
ncbi:MAG: M56 family metallopeptidase, partial [Planctomycetota bacterium]